VKEAVNFIGAFEEALVREARESQADGVICGHIHHAAMHDKYGASYYNCGDWIESCTALAEHHDGHMEIIHWGGGYDQIAQVPARSRSEPVAA
jgi:UDP-2,3-diacylglucosamine pyrophosphatase LpxH